MQCLSSSSSVAGNEPFHSQKTDLIAELKLSKDISGIKKMKVERAKMEKSSEVYSDGKHQFSVQNFVDTVNRLKEEKHYYFNYVTKIYFLTG